MRFYELQNAAILDEPLKEQYERSFIYPFIRTQLQFIYLVSKVLQDTYIKRDFII